MQLTDAPERQGRRRRPAAHIRWRWGALVAGIVGAVLRLRRFALGQSFWLDEALLAQNVVDRGPAGLLEPLDGNQGAPVGFLWILDALHAAFGVDERWMRSPALLAGLALLPLTWLLARRLASERAAALAVGLVAVSPGLVRYSAELKQYSSDAAISVALVLAAGSVGRDRRGLGAMAAAGAVAVWFSHAAVLVLGGIGLVWLARAARDRDVAGVLRLVPVGAAWAASLAALHLLNLRDLASNEFLTDYWQAGYPSSAAPHHLAGWAWTNTTDLVSDLGGHVLAGLVVAGIVAGAVLVARRRPWQLALALASVPVLAVAASFDLYPYRGRLALFLLPILLVLLAALADAPGRWRTAGTVSVVAALIAPTGHAVDELVDPLRFPAASSTVDFLVEHRQPGEAIYVHGPAEHPFRLYTSGTDVRISGTTAWKPPEECSGDLPLDRLDGRAWFFFAYTHSERPDDERSIILSQLDAAGRPLEIARGHDAFAALYDLGAAPAADGERRVSDVIGCLTVREA